MGCRPRASREAKADVGRFASEIIELQPRLRSSIKLWKAPADVSGRLANGASRIGVSNRTHLVAADLCGRSAGASVEAVRTASVVTCLTSNAVYQVTIQ